MEAASPGQNQSDRSEQVRIALAASGVVLIGGLNSGWIGPIIPTIAQAQSLSLQQAGWLVSACGAGSILSISLGKGVVQCIGAKNTLQAGAVLTCAGLAAVAAINGLAPLVAAVLVLGIGLGLTGVAATLCVLEFCGTEATPALNRLHLFFGAGALLGPLVAERALAGPLSYRAAYLGGAVLAFAVAVLLASVRTRQAKGPAPGSKAGEGLWQVPAVWLYAAAMFLYVGVEAGIATWLFTYLVGASRLPEFLASLSMSILWAGLTLGRLLTVHLSKTIPASTITMAALLVSSAAIATLIIKPALGIATLIVVAFLGYGFGPIYPSTLAEANMRFRAHASSLTPLLILAGALGGMTYPALTGYVLENFGLPAGMGALFLTALIMLVAFAAGTRTVRVP